MRVWVATVVRLVLAAAWAYAGIATVGDPAGTVRTVQGYGLLPDGLERGIGYGLPFVALALAVLLLIGLAVRLTAAVSAVLALPWLVGLVAGQSVASVRSVALAAALFLLSAGLAWQPETRFAVDDVLRRSASDDVPEVRVGPRRTAEARRRQAELAAARAAAGQRRVRLAGALAGVLLLAAAGVGIAVQTARASSGPSAQPISVADGVKLGRSSARVTLELYEDPLCTVCSTFEQTAGGQLQTWVSSSTATVDYHVVSFLDGQSPTKYPSRAAEAVYCAADAGRFRQYHDLIFANVPTPGAEPTDAQLITLGQRAGITGPQYAAFSQCVKTKKYADLVSRISDQASRDGVLATPTLLVDGNPVQDVTLAGVTAAVNAAV